jgi:hypothetical protein
MVAIPVPKRPPDFTPAMRPPKASRLIARWPPEGFIFAQGLHGRLNWWNLARAVGRDDPWDLIIYNFATEDPAETNWYMHHFLGCWRSNDGSNFSFEDADPGVVYVPPATWRPPAGFKKGSRGGYRASLAGRVAGALVRVAAICPLVTYQRLSLSGLDFALVAEHVRKGRVAVRIDPSIEFEDTHGAFGVYHHDNSGPDANTIFFYREPNLAQPWGVLLVAHEAAHAAFDVRRVKIPDRKEHTLLFGLESILAWRLKPEGVEDYLRHRSEDPRGADLLFLGWLVGQMTPQPGMIDLAHFDHPFPNPFREGAVVNPIDAIRRYMGKPERGLTRYDGL